jgi:hypothetical protein
VRKINKNMENMPRTAKIRKSENTVNLIYCPILRSFGNLGALIPNPCATGSSPVGGTNHVNLAITIPKWVGRRAGLYFLISRL